MHRFVALAAALPVAFASIPPAVGETMERPAGRSMELHGDPVAPMTPSPTSTSPEDPEVNPLEDDVPPEVTVEVAPSAFSPNGDGR